MISILPSVFPAVASNLCCWPPDFSDCAASRFPDSVRAKVQRQEWRALPRTASTARSPPRSSAPTQPIQSQEVRWNHKALVQRLFVSAMKNMICESPTFQAKVAVKWILSDTNFFSDSRKRSDIYQIGRILDPGRNAGVDPTRCGKNIHTISCVISTNKYLYNICNIL